MSELSRVPELFHDELTDVQELSYVSELAHEMGLAHVT